MDIFGSSSYAVILRGGEKEVEYGQTLVLR